MSSEAMDLLALGSDMGRTASQRHLICGGDISNWERSWNKLELLLGVKA